MSKMIEKSVARKKLYKSKKNWVVAGLTTAFLMVNQVNVSADQNQTGTSTTQASQDASTNQGKTAGTVDSNTTVNQNLDATHVDDTKIQKPTDPNSASKDNQSNVDTGVTTNSQSSETAVITSQKIQTETTQDNHVIPETGLLKNDNQIRYVNPDGTVLKGAYQTVNGNTYYFDNDTGDALVGLHKIGDAIKGFSIDGVQVKGDYLTAANGDKYYFDANGNTVSGVQQINGKTYYFDNTGKLMKGYTAVLNGVVTYFNNTTGEADNTDAATIKTGVTVDNSDYTVHNAAYDNTAASFDNINGYLTAESWYRPKEILENGVSWRPSTAEDKRPILITWQPDIVTEANYLNAMAANGLLSINVPFTAASDLAIMNDAVRAVQKNIEIRISQEKSTDWLKAIMTKFVNTQPQWNETSESPNNDHLQGGALTYVNSPLTPDANSNFRLFNRTPTNQSGETRYDIDKSKGGYELLLANDVDNSNPVVQAEQLNWLYYLMNFGSITANDPTANFDGIRVDAVDNVDADLLQITADYFKLAYGTNSSDENANQHLSILEDWSANDAQYMSKTGSNQLTMDTYTQQQLLFSLTKKVRERADMRRFLEYYMINRANDSTENVATPNYSFVRAHDSEVQTVIASIIKDLHPDVVSGLVPTKAQLDEAFAVYNADMNRVDKQYTQYNMPSAYAMLLTNKDTIPRVYYGDLYTDDGEYMGKQTPYYDAIVNLLKSRIKYVAGGQSMSVDQHDILTSVRYGKNLADVNATSNDTSSINSGIGVIVSNNPTLSLAEGETVVLHMGIAHANQVYREILETTENGIANNTNIFKTTDKKGDLIFTAAEIHGYSNVQVSGFLSVWAPKDAADDQDVRTAASESATTDGNTLHSNAALDSNVIYEGFSNFQSTPQSESEFTNVKIAINVNMFKSWGITSFQMAPQYRSSTDKSFLDSIIQNGYAFTDRYDLGFNTPTKYGTDQQLRDAIKALHASGIQAMADFVPDQIYNLPQTELVSVVRTDSYGKPSENSNGSSVLYVSHTVGGGEYQNKYGGEFLATIKSKYPSLFKTIQVSTGLPIDDSTKIKEWSAKYFNGSNIQGRGFGYVLSDGGTQNYFKVISNSTDDDFLPNQLTGKATLTGFEQTSQGVVYYSKSGIQAQNEFVKDDISGNYYYFNKDGLMTVGSKTINGKNYMFLPNGVELRGSFLQTADGIINYYAPNGAQVHATYVTDTEGNIYYFDSDGEMVIGVYTVDGHSQYFGVNGVQVKDAIITYAGVQRYYQAGDGNLVTNQYIKYNNSWYYANTKGQLVTGVQNINGNVQYFGSDGKQVKGQIIDYDGNKHYYDATSGNLVKNSLVTFNQGKTQYYADQDGNLSLVDAGNIPKKTGFQQVGNQQVYYGADGMMRYGAQNITGHWYLFDAHTGVMQTGLQQVGNKQYYYGSDGIMRYGAQNISGHWYLFDTTNGAMQTGFQQVGNNKVYYGADGIMRYGEQKIAGHWYLFDAITGAMQTGFQQVGSKQVYYGKDGVMWYGEQNIGGHWYLFDANTGAMQTGFQQVGNKQVYYGADGIMRYGEQNIGGQMYLFDMVTGAMKK